VRSQHLTDEECTEGPATWDTSAASDCCSLLRSASGVRTMGSDIVEEGSWQGMCADGRIGAVVGNGALPVPNSGELRATTKPSHPLGSHPLGAEEDSVGMPSSSGRTSSFGGKTSLSLVFGVQASLRAVEESAVFPQQGMVICLHSRW